MTRPPHDYTHQGVGAFLAGTALACLLVAGALWPDGVDLPEPAVASISLQGLAAFLLGLAYASG